MKTGVINDQSFEFLLNNLAMLTNIISEKCPTFALFKSVFRLHLLCVVFKLCALKVSFENFRAFAFCLRTTVPFVTAHPEILYCTHHPVIPDSDLYFPFCSIFNALSKKASK